jgi:cystathionine beta-lyase/cystathionine gamma-synthase
MCDPNTGWMPAQLETLKLRMERAAQSAPGIADRLREYPLVERTHYPHPPDKPPSRTFTTVTASPAHDFCSTSSSGEAEPSASSTLGAHRWS